MQRKVQFLQKKLIEKSSQQSESKEQAKHTKTSNRDKSERTKILPNHQETSNQQGRNVHKNMPNNKVLSTKLPHKKDNTKDLPPKRDHSTMKTKEHKKTLITIAGDSMLNYIVGQKLSKRTRATKVHSFPGATSEDMLDFIRPLAYRNPDSIIVHAGTNDLPELTTKEILENYLDIMATIKEINPEIKIVFSSVVQRHDDISLQPRIHDLNNQMREFCNKHKPGFIDNSNMKDNHIGLKGLHLN